MPVSESDNTGQSRLLRNLVSSWVTQVVLIAIGFVMPRVIDLHVGQRVLGIWDFGWSLVSYLSIASLGVGSAVNRYVGRFRATGEWDRLNRYIASVAVIQICVAAITAAGTITLAILLPGLFADRLGEDADMASTVILFLGLSLSVTMLFDPARGIISGSHRWDIHNMLNVGSHFVASIGMIISLVLGFGLVGMSICYFCAALGTELLRVAIARRICPQIRLRLSFARRSNIQELIRFGLKSVIIALPRVLVTQTSSIFLLSAMGPAAVAILSRPLSLVGHITIFVDKFSNLLTPTVGAMQGLGQKTEMRNLMFRSTKFAAAIALPPTLFLAINGDWVLLLWMGSDYVAHSVVATLAAGFFLSAAQSPVLSVLIGLNMHGRIGLITFVISLLTLAVGFTYAYLIGWSIGLAAAIIALGIGIGHGIALPALACRALGVSYFKFLRHSFSLPLVAGAVFAGILLLGRQVSFGAELPNIVFSSALASTVVAAIYWKFLLSADAKGRLVGKLPAFLNARAR